VWSLEFEYQLKRAITSYPTVGSLSNFYRDFQSLFSYPTVGYIQNAYSVTRMSIRPYKSICKSQDNQGWIKLKKIN